MGDKMADGWRDGARALSVTGLKVEARAPATWTSPHRE
jgi:hypothetical protein